MSDHSQTEVKTRTLRKDLERKSGSSGSCRPKETTLMPKRAEICLQEVPKISRSGSQSTPRFGQLSHNSFFSRHNPHPNRVSHIQDLSGKPICTVRDSITRPSPPQPVPSSNFSISILGAPQVQMPIGDPQSLVEPRLTLNSLSNVWREELKELASKVAAFSKESETKKKKEETERLAQYSPETGRLIPGYIRTMTSRASRTSHRGNLQSKDMTPVVQDQELLFSLLPGDGSLLQTAVSGMFHESLISLPGEKIMTPRSTNPNSSAILNQSLIPQRSLKQSQNGPKAKAEPASSQEKPEYIGNSEVLQLYENPEDRKKKV